MKPPLSAMRCFVDAYRLQTLPLAEWFFRDSEATIRTPLFEFVLPTKVSRSGMHRQICLMRERFIAERHLLFDLLKPGDTVIDVGANIGYYALLLESRIGNTGTVICIEPEPDNLQELHDCVAANDLANVRIVEAAVGDRIGWAQVRRGLNSGICDSGGIAVSMITLDSMKGECPDLVKIDIEGFEGQALAGAQDFLLHVSPSLFVEVHPELLNFGYSVLDVIELVRPYYSDIRFFEPATQDTLIQKIFARYGRGVQEVSSREQVLQRQRTDPFWMICRNDGH